MHLKLFVLLKHCRAIRFSKQFYLNSHEKLEFCGISIAQVLVVCKRKPSRGCYVRLESQHNSIDIYKRIESDLVFYAPNHRLNENECVRINYE